MDIFREYKAMINLIYIGLILVVNNYSYSQDTIYANNSLLLSELERSTGSTLTFSKTFNQSFYNFKFEYQIKSIIGAEMYSEFNINEKKRLSKKVMIDNFVNSFHDLNLDLIFLSQDSSILTFRYRELKFVEVSFIEDKDVDIISTIIDLDHKYKEGNDKEGWNETLERGPGKCFAKTMMLDQFVSAKTTIFQYTGNNFNENGIEKIEFQFFPATFNLVKRKISNRDFYNCNCSDSSYVYKYIYEPPLVVNYYIVIDTVNIKYYKEKILEYEFLKSNGGHLEWQEVLCDRDINEDVIDSCRIKLTYLGYLDPSENYKDDEIRDALIAFQKDFRLPVGNFNIKSMNLLSELTKE